MFLLRIIYCVEKKLIEDRLADCFTATGLDDFHLL